MKLLLDEHYSRQIAERLRERGHDVVSVTEPADLQGLPDDELLSLMAAERRAIVTENWGDFGTLINDAAIGHYGVLFTSRRQLPRSRGTTGLYISVLDEFLRRHPADDAILDSYRWLPDRSSQL